MDLTLVRQYRKIVDPASQRKTLRNLCTAPKAKIKFHRLKKSLYINLNPSLFYVELNHFFFFFVYIIKPYGCMLWLSQHKLMVDAIKYFPSVYTFPIKSFSNSFKGFCLIHIPTHCWILTFSNNLQVNKMFIFVIWLIISLVKKHERNQKCT